MDFKERTSDMDAAIIAYCKKRNMQVHIAGDLIFITTPFGKWYMDKTEFPINLYHGNSWTRSRAPGKVKFKAEYHKQGKSFESYFKALYYIYKHDFGKIKRDIARENNSVKNANS